MNKPVKNKLYFFSFKKNRYLRLLKNKIDNYTKDDLQRDELKILK